MMQLPEFHNALRILLNIDADEFLGALYPEDGGALPPSVSPKWTQWNDFRRCPHRWFIQAPTSDAEAVWALVVKRQPTGG